MIQTTAPNNILECEHVQKQKKKNTVHKYHQAQAKAFFSMATAFL